MTIRAMEGLDPNLPTEIKVDFAASPVTSTTWRVNDYGLVAVVPASGGGTDTYFVPWSRLSYAKQHTAPAP